VNAKELASWGEVIDAFPDDPSTLASLLSRLAARLWVRGGGSATSFARMAETQADMETIQQAREAAE